jgi:triosephosphate isomerase (TIM)
MFLLGKNPARMYNLHVVKRGGSITMRIPMVAGNWKMNTTLSEATKLVKEIDQGLTKSLPIEVVVCPPFISIAAIQDLLIRSQIKMGAQNMFYEEKGAYTGEISPLMLAGLCQYVIIGHSERRLYFMESDEVVNRKVKAALKANLKPIVCVGENWQQYEARKTEEIVSKQIKRALAETGSLDNITVAYEPVWAIGTGKAANGEEANLTIGLIRSVLAHMFSNGAADKTRILYGGSVNAANMAEFMRQSEIDGGLVGGASLKASDFLEIIRSTMEARKLG